MDAALALYKTLEIKVLKKSKKGTSKTKNASSDFVLWAFLKEKCAAMYSLAVDDYGRDTCYVSSEKNLGKRKKDKSRDSRRVTDRLDPSEKILIVNEFCKAVELLHAVFHGTSDNISSFREELMSSEEKYLNLSSIFLTVRNVIDKIVTSPPGELQLLFDLNARGEHQGDEIESNIRATLEDTLTHSVRLWLAVLCQRTAQKEDYLQELALMTEDMKINENQEDGDATDSSNNAATELSIALSWMTNTVMTAFEAQAKRDSEINLDAVFSPMKAKLKTGENASTVDDHNDDNLAFSMKQMSFLDSLLASAISVLVDALLSEIAADTIISFMNNWSKIVLSVCRNRRRGCPASKTINVFSRLCFAIYSTKVQCPLIISEDPQRKSQFDESVDELWDSCISSVLLHVQRYHPPCPSVASDDGEDDTTADDLNRHTDNIDLRILYSMMQLPNLSAGKRMKTAQEKFAKALMKKILNVVFTHASVKEGALEALVDENTSTLAACTEEEQASRKQKISDLIQWADGSAQSCLLFDILMRKVCFSDNVTKFLLKYLRSLLLKSIPKYGSDEDTVDTGDSILIALLIKQIMIKSTANKSKGSNVDEVDGSGSEGNVGLIMSTVETLVENGKDSGKENNAQLGMDIDKSPNVKKFASKSADLSSRVVSLLRF